MALDFVNDFSSTEEKSQEKRQAQQIKESRFVHLKECYLATISLLKEISAKILTTISDNITEICISIVAIFLIYCITSTIHYYLSDNAISNSYTLKQDKERLETEIGIIKSSSVQELDKLKQDNAKLKTIIEEKIYIDLTKNTNSDKKDINLNSSGK